MLLFSFIKGLEFTLLSSICIIIGITGRQVTYKGSAVTMSLLCKCKVQVRYLTIRQIRVWTNGNLPSFVRKNLNIVRAKVAIGFKMLT